MWSTASMKKYPPDFGMTDVELARRLKISKHAVGKWRKRGRIPAERVLAVERETGVSRHEIRPDLYPIESETKKPAGRTGRAGNLRN